MTGRDEEMRNGFFSFSILALTGLMLTMAMTTAVLARAQLLSVQTDEEKVRLTYLAESALREGWQELQAEPERLFERCAADRNSDRKYCCRWRTHFSYLPLRQDTGTGRRLSPGRGGEVGPRRTADVRPGF